MICYEYLVPVHGGVDTCSHGWGKAHVKVPKGYDRVWPHICERLEDLPQGYVDYD